MMMALWLWLTKLSPRKIKKHFLKTAVGVDHTSPHFSPLQTNMLICIGLDVHFVILEDEVAFLSEEFFPSYNRVVKLSLRAYTGLLITWGVVWPSQELRI